MIRSLVAGSSKAGDPALSYQGRVILLCLEALRGPKAQGEPSVAEGEQSTLLILVWLASLVAWSAGTVDGPGIQSTMDTAIRHIVTQSG